MDSLFDLQMFVPRSPTHEGQSVGTSHGGIFGAISNQEIAFFFSQPMEIRKSGAILGILHVLDDY